MYYYNHHLDKQFVMLVINFMEKPATKIFRLNLTKAISKIFLCLATREGSSLRSVKQEVTIFTFTIINDLNAQVI